MNQPKINFGVVKHQRLRPAKNAFGYGVFTLSIPMRTRKYKPDLLSQYGLNDNRVDIKEQSHLYSALQANNIKTKFIKIPGAGHGMEGSIAQVKKIIVEFLQSP